MKLAWHDLFEYNPITGKLFWKITRSNRAVAGKEAGTIDKDGYVNVNTCGKVRKAHRIIWDMLYPDAPVQDDGQIDHINHIRDDNRKINLRKVSVRGNRMNISHTCKNTSGVMGVSWCPKKNAWRAHITVCKRFKHLGYFSSLTDASAARKDAEIKYGFHENHGLKLNETNTKDAK